ncbi:hypothetical protein ABXS71_12010 [Bacillus infantis]|jgi:hypothetical protein|uniref:hypothetical protein n=1 Tax=Bacillus infantis TaxID=324767 RepID=UPI00344B5B24
MCRIKQFRYPEHYDQRAVPYDEKILSLLIERKTAADNNPGTPPEDQLEQWAEKYGLYPDFVKAIFGTMRIEEELRPRAEPEDFIKYVPVMRSAERDGKLYSMTAVKQYSNASVITMAVEWDGTAEEHVPGRYDLMGHFRLYIEGGYDCRARGAKGGNGSMSYTFTVVPPLPENLEEISFVFERFEDPFGQEPSGFELKFNPIRE